MEDQPVQSPISEPAPTSVKATEPKSKFPVMYLVLSVFILLFLASTAFLYYQNMQLKKMLASYQSPVVSPTPSATPDLTANWKTFTKSDWSFKYPPNLFAKEPASNIIDLVDSADAPASNAVFSVDARLIAPYLNDYNTAVARRASDLNIIVAQTSNLPNGVIISGKLGPGMGEGMEIMDGLIKYKGGAISVQSSGGNINLQTFNQILSTFKFLDQTQTLDATNWKTYTNSKAGFEFKYPSNWTEKLPTAGDPTIIYIWSNEELGGQNGADSLKYYIFLAEEKALPTGVNYSEEIINNRIVKVTTDLPSAMGCLNYFFGKSITSYVKIVLCPFDIQKPFVKQTEYLNIFKQILSTFKFIK